MLSSFSFMIHWFNFAFPHWFILCFHVSLFDVMFLWLIDFIPYFHISGLILFFLSWLVDFIICSNGSLILSLASLISFFSLCFSLNVGDLELHRLTNWFSYFNFFIFIGCRPIYSRKLLEGNGKPSFQYYCTYWWCSIRWWYSERECKVSTTTGQKSN